jgi:hypothetical protein
MRAEKS